MTDATPNKPVVVGVDGSPSAIHAARWAAAEAARRGTSLVIVHSSPRVPVHSPQVAVSTAEFSEAVRDQARHWLATAEASAAVLAPQVEISTELLTGGAAQQLIGRSASAELVVLGSRGLGGFTGLLVGAIAVAVSTHALCPVVVVREAQPQADRAEDAPIVVGVDGSAASDAALQFAFETAALRGAPVLAVRTWLDAVVDATRLTVLIAASIEAIEADERRLLAEQVAGCAKACPDVPVRMMLSRDGSARVLVEQSASAQLVVVGTRGRGGFRGLLLGSTSQSLIHHSECPVAIIPPAHR
ncbi:universal stress protein [Lentzea sp. BCCO 10_0061]|uniref:Universal stress protein n=1 Tax=Lentzea sokolovensis TaxID=3095429 RepID=A0ABU4VBP2_9PSEU|nr:universal stress protein [Lentzea sp. BCCO 10_0061]MDX8148890.1 universal stress protein [Lentzea sp. BCCO 10_0061]